MILNLQFVFKFDFALLDQSQRVFFKDVHVSV